MNLSEAKNSSNSQRELCAAIIYSDYTLLTIKNPDNQATKSDLLRILYHLRDILGYSLIHKKSFEKGKQNQIHIHAIIKKKMPSEANIQKYSKAYKLRKLKYLEIFQGDPLHEDPEIIEFQVDTKKFIWHISKIEDAEHFHRLNQQYLDKEKFTVDFID